MFSGIIKEKGEIKYLRINSNSGVIGVYAHETSKNAYIGQSIAVDGICLTVKRLASHNAFFDFSPETYNISTLKCMKISGIVNIEPALSVNSDISGHFVLGHVDSVGRIILKKPYKNAYILGIKINDEQFKKYLINKGSVSIDGISLTVNDIQNNDFYVSIIPLTYKHTNIENKQIGDYVNLEFDIIEKTVVSKIEEFLQNHNSEYNNKEDYFNKINKPNLITIDFLNENGFL